MNAREFCTDSTVRDGVTLSMLDNRRETVKVCEGAKTMSKGYKEVTDIL